MQLDRDKPWAGQLYLSHTSEATCKLLYKKFFRKTDCTILHGQWKQILLEQQKIYFQDSGTNLPSVKYVCYIVPHNSTHAEYCRVSRSVELNKPGTPTSPPPEPTVIVTRSPSTARVNLPIPLSSSTASASPSANMILDIPSNSGIAQVLLTHSLAYHSR
jgi:hypothetical protein